MTKRRVPKASRGDAAGSDRLLRSLLEQARKAALKSAPKKHHLIPASYLRRWQEGRNIRVTWVDEGRSYLNSPENAARETDYYLLASPDVDPETVPPLLFEVMLGEVEQWAKAVIDKIISSGLASISMRERVELAWFLAFQVTRGHRFRVRQREMANDLMVLQYGDLTPEGARHLLKERKLAVTDSAVEEAVEASRQLRDGEIFVSPQDVAIVASSGEMALVIGEHLVGRNWQVYDSIPNLVTCDEPVVPIGGPGASREEWVGYQAAGAVIFPLSPSKLLVMFREDLTPMVDSRLSREETVEVNREIISAASRWAFERPVKHVTERLRVPPVPSPMVVRDGPYWSDGDGRKAIFRTYSPTRWQKGLAPPWPVARWWERPVLRTAQSSR
ncbi:DUF4238 domain-containing protein [Streptomyces polygonati]|uniref:DUF4238 domain-containing protein n=1 Tax=Streptomyces polygonati TaxID=1617087 RepID=A0ABV8HQ08_9ACTN